MSENVECIGKQVVFGGRVSEHDNSMTNVERGRRAKALLKESKFHSLPVKSDSEDCGVAAKKKLRQYTQKELAEMCGYSEVHFSRIMSGNATMDEDFARRIAAAIIWINEIEDDQPEAIRWEWVYAALPEAIKTNRDVLFIEDTEQRYKSLLQEHESTQFFLRKAADSMGLHIGTISKRNDDGMYAVIEGAKTPAILRAADVSRFQAALVNHASLLLARYIVNQQHAQNEGNSTVNAGTMEVDQAGGDQNV